MKMQTIAERTGLRSASYFAHYFKRYTGYTPQEYRKSRMGIQESVESDEKKKTANWLSGSEKGFERNK